MNYWHVLVGVLGVGCAIYSICSAIVVYRNLSCARRDLKASREMTKLATRAFEIWLNERKDREE